MSQRGYGGPLRYIQGPGVGGDVGRYVAPLGRSALVIVDAFLWDTLRPRIEAALAEAGVEARCLRFGGESSDAEVERCTAEGRSAAVVIGVGGGKALDTAKITASRLGARIVTVPTIASTDSPTSAIGVIYSPEDVYDRVVRCGRNPDAVLVDSAVIAAAPARFLVSGMGDALSTFYEARSNRDTRSRNYVGDGYAPTVAGFAIAREDEMRAVGEAAMAPASVIHSVPVALDARLVADAIWTASAIADGRKAERGFARPSA